MKTIRHAVLATALAIPPALMASTTVGGELPCPKTIELGAASADRRATEEIQRRIATDESLSPRGRLVAVSTSDGVVTLSGEIENAEDGLVLASFAEGIPGVRRVEDRLEVRR